MLEDKNKELNRHFLTLWIVWAAMLGSLGIYLLICHAAPVIRVVEGPISSLDLFRNILLGVSAVELLILYFVRRAIFSPIPRRSVNSRPETRPIISKRMFMSKYGVIVIISLAVSESIGVYGMVLFLLGDAYSTLYTFILISALAMFAFRPKAAELERLSINHIFK